MKPWIARAWFAFGLAAAAPISAQAPATDAEAQSHILSAFTSGADPRLLADGVTVGPALRQQLGAEADSRKVYDALIELSSGKRIRVRALGPGEVVRYASLAGVNVGEPLFALQADDLVLLLQYASRQKRVSFIEQLGGAAPRAAVPAPKPAPMIEAPPPTVPPVAVPPPPPKQPPAPVAVPAPAAQPPVVAKPAPPVRVEKPRPRGECVIKPVMSEEDLWNCSGPPSPAAVERPAPPLPAQTSPPPAAPALQAPPRAAECVIKPVMSDEELRACGVRR